MFERVAFARPPTGGAEEPAMQHSLLLSVVSVFALAALSGGATTALAAKAHKPARAHMRADPRKPAVIIFNRDSKDPNVGWHWVNGMRTCTQDCENPEAPGSGYTCTYHADGWRECVK